jgi:tetratricopeptide (TPR) repeat protein
MHPYSEDRIITPWHSNSDDCIRSHFPMRKKKGPFRKEVIEFALDRDVEEEMARTLSAIKKHPNNSAFYVNLGDLYYSQRKMEEAVRTYVQALQVDPRNTRAHTRLGQICAIYKLYSEAWQHARAAESLGDPHLKEQLERNGIAEPSA